eukprot:CAMPEP_0195139066 /NCGR_PEP_ID=MMETSP0448-20130528/158705_1 /TAXON_ID=66468 /ORGANISM="Heterocapsa triquestra, Strain CCMP 448" /LENGTH=55 /DNA_ID=CAMNT_0040177363 /DNA_START=134 /DNA_END=298 /DNA_ORIENTATION=+
MEEALCTLRRLSSGAGDAGAVFAAAAAVPYCLAASSAPAVATAEADEQPDGSQDE